MNFYKIKKTDKDVLVVYINHIFSEEFSDEYFGGEEFSAELIEIIRKKYPRFKKGIIKVMAGSLVISTIYLCGDNITVNSHNYVYSAPLTFPKRLAMSYLYFGSPASQIAEIKSAAGVLDTVSPSYFDITADGNLKITPLCDREVINVAHDLGMKVTPFLSNHWDRDVGAAAFDNAESLTSQLASAILEYGLDGINIDIENMTHKHRQAYVDFVKLLRTKLPEDKIISVAVAANPNGWTSGWQGSYNYEALASHSDYLIIMAYDEHYRGSSPGSVASIQFTEKSIKYALKYVPAEKIVLALPFYGRYWKDGDKNGGQGISLSSIDHLFKNYESSISYDRYTKTPSASFTVKNEDTPPYVGGNILTPGKYTVHFENEISIREKLLLLSKYNLKGSGSWSLGQETDDVWRYYTKWANGLYFSDIAASWAREEIMDTLLRGEMKGVNSSYFEPERAITRGEFVTLILRKFNIPVENNLPTPFFDTATHWAKDEINTASACGIIQGIGNKKFLPDKPVTRQEVCVMLRRVMNIEFSGNFPEFPDVSENSFAYKDIAAAASIGLLNGYPDGTFRPEKGITRAEVSVVMCRIFEKSGVN